MSEKQKPRTNPRAGSNDPELWDLELDWYFNEFESEIGLQSIGTSGAGESYYQLTEEEKAEREERLRNGFLLTMPTVNPTEHSVSGASADHGAFLAASHGIYGRGRRTWRSITTLPYRIQELLRFAYEERIPEAGADWGRKALTDDQVRALHRAFRGRPYELPEEERQVVPERTPRPWKNPEPVGAPHEWKTTTNTR